MNVHVFKISNMKSVPDFQQYYVTSTGKVCNKDAQCLAPYIERTGYKCVTLQDKGRRKNFRIHRLVAELYIDNPHKYKHIGYSRWKYSHL